MINILGHIPKTHFHVACSGGSDSMVLVDFLLKFPQNKFDLLYFDHGTECCGEAKDFLMSFAKKHDVDLKLGKISREKEKSESQEEYWRKERYSFLKTFSDEPILMAHHLNDVIETWVMTSLQGHPQLIPFYNKKYNVYRPMLCVPKREIANWAQWHDVEYVYDKSNGDTSIKRNYVRHKMMDEIYHISPGIETILQKKILEEYKRSGFENDLHD